MASTPQLFGTKSSYEPLVSSYEPLVINIIRNGPLVSEDQTSIITRNISLQKIEVALFSIKNEKAPGPDGFTSHFFKMAWHLVSPEFSQAVQEFFASSTLLKKMNHTLIACIPKSSHAPSVRDFHPISRFNVSYKVISKILANRLAPMLSSLVD